LSQVSAPVYIFYGGKDIIASPQDVEWLAGKLGNLKALKEIANYNHIDFFTNKNAKEVLYNDIFNLLPPPSI